MHFDVPDPAFSASAQLRASFRLSAQLAAGFVTLLWLIQLMNWGLDLDAQPFGIRPRQAIGLVGIATAPLMHAGFDHLFANTPPLLVIGTAMLYLYPRSALRVLPAVYLAPGVAVWLFGAPGSVHVGASGLVYGLAFYVLAAGALRRDRRAIAAALVVVFLYGSLAWGVLPIQPQVSWETHLAAAIVGALFAVALRRLDVPPRKRYTWEDEPDADEADDSADQASPDGGRAGPT